MEEPNRAYRFRKRKSTNPGHWTYLGSDKAFQPLKIENWRMVLEALADNDEQRARRSGRRKKTEKDSAPLVVAALNKRHGYEGGSVTKYEPATNRGLADRFGTSPNALSRFLKDQFPKEKKPGKKYQAACRNKTIGGLLALWNRELPGRMADLTPGESGRPKEED
jgi:hypothetical protein